MTPKTIARAIIGSTFLLTLSACGGDSGLFGRGNPIPTVAELDRQKAAEHREETLARMRGKDQGKIWDLFNSGADPNITVEVNRYLWNASLDVLSFLPVEAIDPFTGVIVMGYGTPPGGGRAYRATVYISDPSLDARALKVALVSRGGGPVSPETARAVEDAILTRARELRVQDGRF